MAVRQAPSPATQAPIALVDDSEDDNGAQSEVFSNYQCRSIDFGTDHPGDIAEAAGLALIPLPPASYPLQDSIPAKIIQDGKLSKLQLEGVLYACQRHLCFLPNGERCGFFIGDGAGVGKGRQIGGIILDNWARGRQQHLWFSISRDLREDAQRDLNDLGLHIKVIDGCQELDAENKAFGLSSEFKDGVLFTTYSTLIGAARGGKLPRLDQIVAWCGGKDVERRKVLEIDKGGANVQKEKLFAPNFSGVVVFDECHRAKNFSLGKDGEEAASDKSSLTSKCVIEIQQRLPRARVVYCSATGVTELSNLAYCERLGLWGQGLPFPNFEKFYNSASKRGVFFLEMLAMELKRSGSYVSRGLSFAHAEFDTLYYELTKQQRKEYDAAARLWTLIRVELQNAIILTGASRRLMSAYWGAHQRFFKQLILAFKVDWIVERALLCLERDQAVIIGLQTTGEAALVRSIERSGGSLSSFVSTTRETMIAFLELHFPTKIEGDPKGDAAESSTSQATAPATAPGISNQSAPSKASGPVGTVVPQCLESRKALLAQAHALDLPISALDNLIDKLGGPTKVAEMTGRKVRLVRNAQGQIQTQQRGVLEDEVDQVNIKECSRFMKGAKLVAIISDAASTGISLHASQECQNRRRRVHFTVELPWSADKAVQQLGRSHRSNQASAPVYQLVVTDLGGERRFAAAVSKRLQSLGALTKGDRRAAAGQDLQEFDLDNMYGRASLKRMFEAIDSCTTVAAGGASCRDLQAMLFGASVDSLPSLTTADSTSVTEQQIVTLNAQLQTSLESIGYGLSRKDNDVSDVKKFLGRLLGLPVLAQNTLFHYFFSVLGFSIASAVKEGRYTDAITDLFGSDSIVERTNVEVVYTDHVTGATSSVHTLRVDRGLTWSAALSKLEEFTKKPQLTEEGSAGSGDDKQSQEADEDLSGFYETRNIVPGRGSKGWLLALQSLDRPHLFLVGRPNTGMVRFEMDEEELHQKYVKKDLKHAEVGWRRLYEESVSFDVGSRILTVHLVTGTLVPLWDQIEQVVRSFAFKKDSTLSKKDVEMKVVRVKVDGQYNVGLKFPAEVIDGLRKQFRQYSLLQSGKAIQIAPPPINQATFAQLSGQELPVPIHIVGQAGSQRVNGTAVLNFSDPSTYRLKFDHHVGGRALRQEIVMKFGSNNAQFVRLTGASGADQSTQMLVEAADLVDSRALGKALTAKPTMKSFFAAVPKPAANSPGKEVESGEQSAAKRPKLEPATSKPLSVNKGNQKAGKNSTSSPAKKPDIFASARSASACGGDRRVTSAGADARMSDTKVLEAAAVAKESVMDLTGDD